MKTYILYHSNCYDGFGSAWAAYKKLGTEESQFGAVKYIPCGYAGKLPEIEDGSLVYFVDFSSSTENLQKLGEKNLVIVLDHHKGAAEHNLKPFPRLSVSANYDLMLQEMKCSTHLRTGVEVRYDQDKSGAMLTWEYFNHDKKVPTLIEYVQDRDLWKWKLTGSRQASAYLRCFDFKFEEWDMLENRFGDDESLITFIKQGSAVLQHDEKQVAMICKNARLVNFRGYKVSVTNTSSHWSEVGEYLHEEKHPDCDFGLSFTVLAGYGNLMLSMRSKKPFDVSVIARSLGGNGHPQAAGANVPLNDGGWEVLKELISEEIVEELQE